MRTALQVALGGAATLAAIACAMGETERGALTEDRYGPERQTMVRTQIVSRGVTDPRVLDALRRVPRDLFVPDELRGEAYSDRPLPIGHQQTISQPYIVALMSELARPDPAAKILEIGTGSGYQAAVLAECAAEVYTIEIVPELGREATARLEELGYRNIHVRIGDGFGGWPEAAPFDAIVVTAAPAEIPEPLLEQLAPGGRLVIPLGEGHQRLVLVTRTPRGFERRTVAPVRFVPMTGKAQQDP